MTPPYSRISELPSHAGETVRVRGWVSHLRSSGKVAFVVLRAIEVAQSPVGYPDTRTAPSGRSADAACLVVAAQGGESDRFEHDHDRLKRRRLQTIA